MEHVHLSESAVSLSSPNLYNPTRSKESQRRRGFVLDELAHHRPELLVPDPLLPLEKFMRLFGEAVELLLSIRSKAREAESKYARAVRKETTSGRPLTVFVEKDVPVDLWERVIAVAVFI